MLDAEDSQVEGHHLSVLVAHAAVSSAVGRSAVVLRPEALVAASSASLRVVTGLAVETYVKTMTISDGNV